MLSSCYCSRRFAVLIRCVDRDAATERRAFVVRWTSVLGLALVLPLFGTSAFGAASTVKVWESREAIPTYLAGDPEPNPMFFFGRESQGAQGPLYPYPIYDSLTGKKVNKTYTVVHLENEYLRISVLPEVGGRIFEGTDKTNNYKFIYKQDVIKPALIGLLGAWISGGVEWNIPHHHRATTFIPVQHKTEENADGSKTVWVGELEVRQRMRWAVGYTLRPGSSVLEASIRIVNRTPVANTMLCFANLAVHVDQNYQVIFPPSTQYGVHHAKRQFTEWPIAHGTYGGADFSKGVDISYYRNHISANSVFAWNYDDDFFAGYDHGRNAGTMSVADHHVVPGKKFWTWGNGANGKRWDATLTDDNGPYIELMVGGYSDNQPDYSWLQPYETRSFTMNWYPFREIGGVKMANLDAAVNLDVANGSAKVGFYATSAHPKARAVVKVGPKTILDQAIAISPAQAFCKEVALPAGTDEHEVTASLWDGDRELVSYTPIRFKPMAVPPVVKPPAPPQEMKTNEELYLTGLRARQFHDPNIDPIPYWQEALRRDPGDTRVNTVLGIDAYQKAQYAKAEQYLRKALERLTDRYTDPKDGEAIYYLGATLAAERKADEAYQWLFKATWSQAWESAAYYGLAQISTSRGEFRPALEQVNRSLNANGLNVRALNLKAALLRHLNRKDEAAQVLAQAAPLADPLDVRSMAEGLLLSGDAAAAKQLADTMNEHPATAQETAAEYLNEGLWADGTAVLMQAVKSAAEPQKIHPMVYYYLGYFAEKQNQVAKAKEFYAKAMRLRPDYVFPFQNEVIEVLQSAMAANPRDARAPYYLGNVLYDWQPDLAAKMWERSAELDPTFAVTHRNLAVAYMHQAGGADLTKAIAELEKAVSQTGKYPLHFTELDELYEQAGVAPEKRLPLFQRNAAVIARRDDALNREIALQVITGNIDSAIQTMSTRSFAVAEGANLNVVEHWTDAHVLRAQRLIREKKYPEALRDLHAAAVIPSNLPIGVGFGDSIPQAAEVGYWTGVALQGSGDNAKAQEAWALAAQTPAHRPSHSGSRASATVQDYYRALCLQKVGKNEEAEELFRLLVKTGDAALKDGAPTGSRRNAVPERVGKAQAHYLAGLGYLGLKDAAQAREQFSLAVEQSPDLLGAQTMLASVR